MKLFRDFFENQRPRFEKEGRWHSLHPLFEALESFLFSSKEVSHGRVHIRDGLETKRLMSVVIVSLIPCVLMAMLNTGHQANLLQAATGPISGWRTDVLHLLGLGLSPDQTLSNFIHGALYFIPALLVTFVVGGIWELLFAVGRKRPMTEGLLVTGMLFPLTLPPSTPLWQVALGISFGIIFGKEVFGGTGRNIFNPAVVGRVFLFFAYPISQEPIASIPGSSLTWWNAFMGQMPGSMGQTSTAACLIGAAILIATGVAAWSTMLCIALGMLGMALTLNIIGPSTNPLFAISPLWHFVLGGFAFGMIFMATDPVTSAMTKVGKVLYGLLIGVMATLIRVFNPACPESMMLAILFGNAFAPIIDTLVTRRNIRRRERRTKVVPA